LGGSNCTFCISVCILFVFLYDPPDDGCRSDRNVFVNNNI